MCMIAQRLISPKGKGGNIPNSVIDTALARHPDGFGVAYRDPKDGLVYEKFGPTDAPRFRARLKEIDADKTVEYVAHFRYATHGPEDASHAHPYSYEDPDPEVGTVLVFHNGVFSKVNTTALESDTEVFVRDVLAKLPSRWWDNAAIRRLVNDFGGWSKLVLMTNDETINLNHYAGEEDGGFWYSSEHRPYSWKSSSAYSSGVYGSSLIDDEYAYEKWGMTGESRGSATNVIPMYRDTTTPRGNDALWLDQQHMLTPLQRFDFGQDGSYEDAIQCDLCLTTGDVYIIDGRAYVDIKHAADVVYEADDDDTLPGESCEVLVPDDKGDAKPVSALTIMQGASGQNYARVN